jgi:hypothetical protein
MATVAGLLRTDLPFPHRDQVSDVGFRLDLSNGEVVDIGPVRLRLPERPTEASLEGHT